MREVFTSTEIDEALVYQALLREHGIDSILENERTAFLVIDMPTCAVPFVISVAEEDAGTAQEVLRAARLRQLHEDNPTPEAIAPETDALQERVKKSRRSRHRIWWMIFLLLFLLPQVAMTVGAVARGNWGMAIAFGVFIMTVPAAAWILMIRHGKRSPHP